MKSVGFVFALVAVLALAPPAVAETEVTGAHPGGAAAFVLGVSCSARSLEAVVQNVTLQIHRNDGTLAASLGPMPVPPGLTATLTANGAQLGFGGSYTCTATAPGNLASALSLLGAGGDPLVTSVGRNP